MRFISAHWPVRRAMSDRKGATMVEYALLAGLVAVVAASALTRLGASVKTEFSTLATTV